MVFIPYCTGDLHAGNNVATYDVLGPRMVAHVGRRNVEALMPRLRGTWGSPRRVVVSGSSAGGYGATLNYDLFRRAYPQAQMTLVDDSGPLLVGDGVPADERAAWWSDASGIPPGAAVGLVDAQATGGDAALPGLLCLTELWTRSDVAGKRLHEGVARTRARLPRADLPIAIVHGVADGLVPIAFSSDPYVRWLEANARAPMYWRVGHAQHFDAFLAFPGFGDRYVPMLPYAYAALDRLWDHVANGTPLPPGREIATTPRGNDVLGARQLGAIPGD
jgi:fermentation-respiration switch protein FrsA (DUF1100 family)